MRKLKKVSFESWTLINRRPLAISRTSLVELQHTRGMAKEYGSTFPR